MLISGSGPLDRNSNTKRRPIDVMRQVAEHLTRAGIARLAQLRASTADVVRMQLIAKVNAKWFRERADDGPPSVRRYPAQLRHPVDRRVLDLTAGWLVNHATGSGL